MQDDQDEVERRAAHTLLLPTDHAAFFGALDMPPAPTDALRLAFQQHRRAGVTVGEASGVDAFLDRASGGSGKHGGHGDDCR